MHFNPTLGHIIKNYRSNRNQQNITKKTSKSCQKKTLNGQKKRRIERNLTAEKILSKVKSEINRSNFLEVWNRITERLEGRELKQVLGRKFFSLLTKKEIDFDKKAFNIPVKNLKMKAMKQLKVDEAKMSTTNAYGSNQKFKGIIYNSPKN